MHIGFRFHWDLCDGSRSSFKIFYVYSVTCYDIISAGGCQMSEDFSAYSFLTVTHVMSFALSRKWLITYPSFPYNALCVFCSFSCLISICNANAFYIRALND